MSAQGPSGTALEIEIVDAPEGDEGPFLRAAQKTLARLGVLAGHVAIEFVDETRIRDLNREHRDKDAPTDVLSFPVDGEKVAGSGGLAETAGAPLELGDVVICATHTEDLVTACVHGVLHLCGYDHETDDGEMLDLQDRLMAELGSRR